MPDPWTLALGVFFGTIGIVALRRGKTETNVTCILLGIALLVFPYFIGGVVPTLVIGVALTAGVWFSWESE